MTSNLDSKEEKKYGQKQLQQKAVRIFEEKKTFVICRLQKRKDVGI